MTLPCLKVFVCFKLHLGCNVKSLKCNLYLPTLQQAILYSPISPTHAMLIFEFFVSFFKKEKERASCMWPCSEPNLQSRHMPWPGQIHDLLVYRMMFQPTEQHQPGPSFSFSNKETLYVRIQSEDTPTLNFFLRFYLFLERGKGGKKSERNINQLLLRHVPWLGIRLATFHFVGWCPTNWATLLRAQH